MITTSIIYKVFCCYFGNKQGSCFTIDVEQKQYLVTATHLIEGISDEGEIKIFLHQQKMPIKVKVVKHCEHDVSVLSAECLLSPPTPTVIPSAADLIYGQDVYFLGFPEPDLAAKIDEDTGHSLPFVKKAICSNIGSNIIYLDGHNTPGFSGGPVIFNRGNDKNFNIAGMVTSYKARRSPVKGGPKSMSQFVLENTGIVICPIIKLAVDAAISNPIGFPLN